MNGVYATGPLRRGCGLTRQSFCTLVQLTQELLLLRSSAKQLEVLVAIWFIL